MDWKESVKKGLKTLHKEGQEYLKKTLIEEPKERKKIYKKEYNKEMKKALRSKARADVKAGMEKNNLWEHDDRFYGSPEFKKKERRIW